MLAMNENSRRYLSDWITLLEAVELIREANGNADGEAKEDLCLALTDEKIQNRVR